MKFENLREKTTKLINDRLQEKIISINEITDKKEILNHWSFNDSLTKSRIKNIEFEELEKLKQIMIKKAIKNSNKNLAETLQKIEDAENAGTLENATITIEWKKSATWGASVTGELKACDSVHIINIIMSAIYQDAVIAKNQLQLLIC